MARSTNNSLVSPESCPISAEVELVYSMPLHLGLGSPCVSQVACGCALQRAGPLIMFSLHTHLLGWGELDLGVEAAWWV